MPNNKQSAYVLIRRPYAHNNLDHKNTYYTVPFYNKHTFDASNALLAFQCESMAKFALDDISTNNKTSDQELLLAEYPIQDIMNYGAMLRIPSVIIVSMYCYYNDVDSRDECNEHYEIFYSDSRSTKYDPSNSMDIKDYPRDN